MKTSCDLGILKKEESNNQVPHLADVDPEELVPVEYLQKCTSRHHKMILDFCVQMVK